MLVIRRRPGESILIGSDIEIEILETTGNKVKLGITGPRAVSVIRKEAHLAAEVNRSASLLSTDLKNLIVKKLAQIPQPRPTASDKTCESGYSGHPAERENPDPA